MDAVVKNHLSVIIAVTLAGLVTGFLGLSFVHGNVGSMDVGLFSGLIFIIPCVIMFVCAFAIASTARTIGRSLFITVLGISLAAGVIAMVVTSSWMSDADVAAQLLANSGEGASVVPVLRSPILVLRDIASFVVVPTVGCILGAWAGSRMHPMRDDGTAQRKRDKKRQKARKNR